MRSAFDLQGCFPLPLTPEDKEVARDTFAKLQLEDSDHSVLHDLMRILWKMLSLSLRQGANGTFLLVFLAAAALRQDGTLMESFDLVHWIKKLKYGARAFCMVEASHLTEQGVYPDLLT